MHVRRWCIEWKILCSHNKAMARNRFISWKCYVHAAMYSFSVNRTKSKLLIFFSSPFLSPFDVVLPASLVSAHTHAHWKSNSHSTSVSQFQLSSIVLSLSPLGGFCERFSIEIVDGSLLRITIVCFNFWLFEFHLLRKSFDFEFIKTN